MKIEIIPFGCDEFYVLEDNVVSYVHRDDFARQFRIGDKIHPDEWARASFDEVLETYDISEKRKLQYDILCDLYSKDYPEYFI